MGCHIGDSVTRLCDGCRSKIVSEKMLLDPVVQDRSRSFLWIGGPTTILKGTLTHGEIWKETKKIIRGFTSVKTRQNPGGARDRKGCGLLTALYVHTLSRIGEWRIVSQDATTPKVSEQHKRAGSRHFGPSLINFNPKLI